MNLDEIKLMGLKTEIDDIELDKSSLAVPKLHAKYSELLTDNIIILKNLQMNRSYYLEISGYGTMVKWTKKE